MKAKILMVVFILILGTLLTTILVAIDKYTAPMIEKNKKIKLETSVLQVFGITCEKKDVENMFAQNVRTINKDGNIFYISKDKNIAFEYIGSGLWGPIRGVIALYQDLTSIKDITIIHQEETPGLGARIAEKGYLIQFKDKKILPQLKIVAQGKSRGDNEIDAITGATMSCEAFGKLLNANIQKYISHLKKEDVWGLN